MLPVTCQVTLAEAPNGKFSEAIEKQIINHVQQARLTELVKNIGQYLHWRTVVLEELMSSDTRSTLEILNRFIRH